MLRGRGKNARCSAWEVAGYGHKNPPKNKRWKAHASNERGVSRTLEKGGRIGRDRGVLGDKQSEKLTEWEKGEGING